MSTEISETVIVLKTQTAPHAWKREAEKDHFWHYLSQSVGDRLCRQLEGDYGWRSDLNGHVQGAA